MNTDKFKSARIAWMKLSQELQHELNREVFKIFTKEPTGLSENDLEKINALKQRLTREIYQELESQTCKARTDLFRPLKKIKAIILDLEILPFQFATRTTDIIDHGKSWRHDGGRVRFKLEIPHDKLEIYSPRGEFLCSYPVQVNGEVQIDDLAAGVYVLYLRGRKIVNFEFAPEE
ncbi:hypothetical protein L0128_22870 [candidate division KSB1 bacterium]|nr:hypothetical protein [candidate division KSB1 bacterium]